MRVISILQKQYESSPDIRLIVICGSNQPLYRRLKERYGERLLLVQHTSQMADYMKACELLISKPGGLSSTEAAVSCTPLIHINPIPGCESKNMEYFSSRGMKPCGSFAAKGAAACRRTAVAALFCPTDARVPAAKHLPPCCRAHLTLPSSLLTATFRLCQNNAEFLYIKKIPFSV